MYSKLIFFLFIASNLMFIRSIPVMDKSLPLSLVESDSDQLDFDRLLIESADTKMKSSLENAKSLDGLMLVKLNKMDTVSNAATDIDGSSDGLSDNYSGSGTSENVASSETIELNGSG